MHNMKIVNPKDEHALPFARMHVKSWHDTYTGLNGVTTEWIENKTNERFEEKGLKKTLEIFSKSRETPDTNYFKFATVEGKIVGFVSGHKTQEEQELTGLYVDSNYHGSGIADTLMTTILEWFDQESDISLWTATGNPRAIKFYQKYSFEIIPESKHVSDKYKPLELVKMIRKAG